jgi:hypothetical protein
MNFSVEGIFLLKKKISEDMLFKKPLLFSGYG